MPPDGYLLSRLLPAVQSAKRVPPIDCEQIGALARDEARHLRHVRRIAALKKILSGKWRFTNLVPWAVGVEQEVIRGCAVLPKVQARSQFLV